MKDIELALAHDDVLLVPKYSDLESRKDVDLSVYLGKGVELKIPIIPSNMKHITEHVMAQSIALLGGLGLIHRFMSIQEECEEYYKAVNGIDDLRYKVGASVGIKDEEFDRVDALCGKYGCKIICVDVAHGHHENCGLMVEYIAEKYPDVLLIAGNIATPEGMKFLADKGADVVRAGIGGGSICLTRIETGNGVPMMSMLQELNSFREANDLDVKIIADGGHKIVGDVVKSLCFADCVMLGNMIAGCDETPGAIFKTEHGTYKEYNGSSTHKNNHVEGVKSLVSTKGSLKDIIIRICEGVRSGCSYQGVSNLDDLKLNPKFVRITSAGLKESHAHDVMLNEK